MCSFLTFQARAQVNTVRTNTSHIYCETKEIKKIESRHDDRVRFLYCKSDRAKSSNRPAKSGSVFYHMINALKKLRLLPAAGVLITLTQTEQMSRNRHGTADSPVLS